MRKFVIAALLSLFATGAIACGNKCRDISINKDFAAAGAAGIGYGSNRAVATSSSRGNGSSANAAVSGTYVGINGYARAGQLGRRPVNGYRAGIDVETGTFASTYSNNTGNAYGGAFAEADAGAIGAAGGVALSKTLNRSTCWWLPPTGGALAGSAAGGVVHAESDAVAHTWGRGETAAGTISGARATLDVEGVADTDSDEFRASASDVKSASTFSESFFDGRRRNGFTYGEADAWAEGGVLAGGVVWNAEFDRDRNDRLPPLPQPEPTVD